VPRGWSQEDELRFWRSYEPAVIPSEVKLGVDVEDARLDSESSYHETDLQRKLVEAMELSGLRLGLSAVIGRTHSTCCRGCVAFVVVCRGWEDGWT